jgi:hypothetical protein
MHVRRRKLLRLLTISLVLGSVGLLDGGIATCLAAAFFGVCTLVFCILMLPGAAYLRLEPVGFTVCNLFRKHFTPWPDVSDFGFAIAGRQELVGYNGRSAANALPGWPLCRQPCRATIALYRTVTARG